MLSLPIDFPGMAYNRAIKGGEMVREELMERSDDEGQDMLSKMLFVRDENGERLNEMEICNNIIGLLVASFDPTSSTLTTVINYIAQLPHIYEHVLKVEQMEVERSKGHDELLA
ncbi:hypothetical protein ACS0TY_028045 [Phlomoides rotata]